VIIWVLLLFFVWIEQPAFSYAELNEGLTFFRPGILAGKATVSQQPTPGDPPGFL
jgi:hypothetical protein